MIYDLIIIGAGAAGLFAGASLPHPVNGLILEKKSSPGKKLLMSGSGQCNLTHGGSMKDFISNYGTNGTQIRSILYRFNNLAVMDFFASRGVPLWEREDGKVFPQSLKAQDVLNVLTEGCRQNGMQFRYSSDVRQILLDQSVYTVDCGTVAYSTKKIIIAAGGCSYPSTGSDGSIFPVLKRMGFELVPTAPALVPVYVDHYPYRSLSGISFQNAEVSAGIFRKQDALLLTHTCFSGPAVLNLSRFLRAGDPIVINYFPVKPEETIVRELTQAISGSGKQILTVLYDYFGENASDTLTPLPKRFLEAICSRSGVYAEEKASRISISTLKAMIKLILADTYRVQKLGGFESAMVTTGGVSLSEINTKTMESKRFPNLYFAGEVLDVDGNTGGYNLQFAFSSGHLAASGI